MNIPLLLAMLAIPGAAVDEKPRLTRILYDVELVHGERRIMVDLVLNQLNDELFSISCRKNPGGLLFTCWATSEGNYIFFPKMDIAFSGPASEEFGLFPGSPEMPREQWFLLLYRRTSGKVGNYDVVRKDGWRQLIDPEAGFTLRWRETRRLFKNRYSKRVFEPQYREVATHPLKKMKKFWETHIFEP